MIIFLLNLIILVVYRNNTNMKGRIFSIKKSTWLMISLILNIVIFLTLSIFSIVIDADYDNIFFLFCLGTGIHQIVKGVLFKFDSSCYLGISLLLVGFFYFFSKMIGILWLYPVFILLSFSFSSFSIGYFFKQPYHFFLSISLFFVCLGLLLFLFKIISVWFFVAILVCCVLLLIVRFLTL